MSHPRPTFRALLVAALVACSGDEPQKGDGGPPDPEPHESGLVQHTGEPEVVHHSAEVEPPPVVEGFALSVDRDVVLMIHATFTDPGAEDSWVEYRFETDEWLVAPVTATGEAVILGIPEQTTVEARAVAVVGGETLYSPEQSITTGSLPSWVLRPGIAAYDPALASPEPYVMVSVATGDFLFEAPYAVEIFDRNGRVVWYHEVPNDLISLYPSVSRDGTHIWYDAENIFYTATGDAHVTRMTLDGRWTVTVPTPDAGQAYAEGPDDSFFYELRGLRYGIMQVDAAGVSSLVWNCSAHFNAIGAPTYECMLNGCNWDEARGTLLASQFESSTVFEVDLATGQALRQFGELEEGDPWTFDPPESNFAYQHWPHWTPQGTLLVSTHAPCEAGPDCLGNQGLEGVQIAAEYVLDDATHTITRIWSHTTTDLWATQAGEAYRLDNGNLVMGYGQDGAAREITPDGQTAWQYAFPRDRSGYRLVGHVSFLGDLYAVNQGH